MVSQNLHTEKSNYKIVLEVGESQWTWGDVGRWSYEAHGGDRQCLNMVQHLRKTLGFGKIIVKS